MRGIEKLSGKHADDHRHIDAHPAQHRHGPLLQLPEVRNVQDVLLVCQIDNDGVEDDGSEGRQTRTQQCDE